MPPARRRLGRWTLAADRDWHVVSTNPTHRTRLARALASAAGIPYQTALSLVADAAEAGALPSRLDPAGMRQALKVLLQRPCAAGAKAGSQAGALELEPRYYRLAQVMSGRLQPGVPQRVARAAGADAPAVRCWGDYDPVAHIGAVMADNGDDDLYSDWWQRVAAAGPRPDCILPDPYPPGSSPDGYLPIDRALDERDATGDAARYHRTLESIVRREPRDIDAWAHLGNVYLDLADPHTPQPPGAPPPGERQRRSWARTALGCYQTAVGVAELALPDPFGGFLTWSNLDNRPFFRALHGMALALWRLGRFDEAEQTLHNMLWLNPMDNQGARDLLAPVRARASWEDTTELPARAADLDSLWPVALLPSLVGVFPDYQPAAELAWGSIATVNCPPDRRRSQDDE
jgi:tetratricopeptide (TPR) repeat protein